MTFTQLLVKIIGIRSILHVCLLKKTDTQKIYKMYLQNYIGIILNEMCIRDSTHTHTPVKYSVISRHIMLRGFYKDLGRPNK